MLLALALIFGFLPADTPQASTALPPGEGKPIVQRACVGCHALKVVTSKRASREQWASMVDQMVTRGADLSDDEIEVVVAYLAKNFGPSSESADQKNQPATEQVNVNQAGAAELGAVLGLSKKDADAIVDYRKQNGKFTTLADVLKVPGIDTAKIESEKDRVRF